MSTTSTMYRADHEQAGDLSGARSSAEPVTLHRGRRALALVAVGSGVTSVAYLWRAIGGESGWFGYLVALALLPVAVVHLAAWWDARAPLLVADDTGIRLREGKSWTGLRWDEVPRVSLTESRLPRRDARLEVDTGSGLRRRLALSMVDPAEVRALPEQIRGLAPASVDVFVTKPKPEPEDRTTEPEAGSTEPEAGRTEPEAGTTEPGPGTTEPEAGVTEPESEPRAPQNGRPQHGRSQNARVARADVVVDAPTVSVAPVAPSALPARELRPELGREPESAPDSVPVGEQVIGPRLVEARRRLRLSVDDLAERTRIRPHVIEAIEADDFSACGGDVYARGHLRVLARILGIEVDQLLREYDARYSAGPVTARTILEAELAGPGRAIRTASGGPRWSVLIGVVLVLVLVWGLARLLVPGADGQGDGAGDRPLRSGSPSISAAAVTATTAEAAASFAGMGDRTALTRVRLVGLPGSSDATDATDATGVTVLTGDGVVVFQDSIAPGEVELLGVPGAATVVTQKTGSIAVEVNGRPAGRLGAEDERVRRTFSPA